MKIRWKVFLFTLGLISVILLGIWIINTSYLEKYYIENQKNKLLELGKILVDPDYVVDLQSIEMHSNVSISIKRLDELHDMEKNSMMDRTEVNSIAEHLNGNVPIFGEVTLLDYRGKSLILFMPYKNGRYFEILSPLNFLSEGIDLSTQYHMRIVIIAMILGSIGAYIFSTRISRPIIKLKKITKSISNLDFSKKFDDKRSDEIGDLGIAVNKMASMLEKNIDEINQKNKILEKDLERERKIEVMRKEFIGNVSHELKTPIAIIQGYAQGLLENVAVNKEDTDFYCNTIIDESKIMNDLVQELLLISKMESKYLELKLERVDYFDAIQEFVERYSHSDKKIIYTGPKSIDVVCEERYIDRVMENFITNAIKYATDKSDIKIDVTEEKDDYKVVVSNETDRLTNTDLENIWIPFYRKNDSRDKEGHGLGLAIVKGILDNHKCEYGAELNGKWISFWFKLHKDFVDVSHKDA